MIQEAQKNRLIVVSAIEKLQVQAHENRILVRRAGAALHQVEKLAGRQIGEAVQQITGEAARVVTANLAGANERAEQIMAATAKLTNRQLWSAAGAMCLTLLPVATVVAGLWMVIAGLFTGMQWATDVDGHFWLGMGRWIAVTCGLSVVAYGLFAGTRWTASMVAKWKGTGCQRSLRQREEKR